jgi:tripartite-type tricarboxylate transporter receptor subunit TctC
MKKLAFLFGVFLAALQAIAVPALAQDWPAKTVKIIVPFGAGSTPDIVARLIAESLQQKYPASAFVVENKPGASGNIGTDAVAKADPDGTTVGVSIGGPLVAVTQLVTMPSVLAVNPGLDVNSVADLVALLKREPGKYDFGSIGNGSLSHLSTEAIALKSGTQIVHVPFTGSPQAMTAVMRGDVQMACLPAASVVALAKDGKVKMLAKRSPFLPDLPTLKESGIGVEADTWMGLIAPGKTPPDLVAKINKDVAEAIRAPAVRDKLATQFMEPL